MAWIHNRTGHLPGMRCRDANNPQGIKIGNTLTIRGIILYRACPEFCFFAGRAFLISGMVAKSGDFGGGFTAYAAYLCHFIAFNACLTAAILGISEFIFFQTLSQKTWVTWTNRIKDIIALCVLLIGLTVKTAITGH